MSFIFRCVPEVHASCCSAFKYDICHGDVKQVGSLIPKKKSSVWRLISTPLAMK